MPRYTHIQNSFLSGEISPKLEARTDIREYANGLETMNNLITYGSGGATRRPGMRILNGFKGLINLPKTFTQYLLEIPFEFGPDKKFRIFLEAVPGFGNIYILDQNNDLVTGSDNIISTAAISELGKGLDISGFHYAQTKKSLFITHESGQLQPIYIAFEFDPTNNPSKEGIFNTDVLGNFAVPGTPSNLFPSDPNSEFIVPDISQVPMLSPNASSNTLGVTAGTIAINSIITLEYRNSSGVPINYFTTNDIGTFYLLDDKQPIGNPPRVMGCVVTAAAASSPNATARIVTLSSGWTNAFTDYWYESAWSTRKGFPRTVTSFESRILFGGTRSLPDTIWASQVNRAPQLNSFLIDDRASASQYARNPDEFTVIPLQVQPFNFNISSQNGSAITWMTSGRALLIGTETTEYAATGGDNSIMTPLLGAIQVKPQSFNGSQGKMPAVSNSKTYFISRDGKSVMEFGFSPDNGTYTSRNLSLISDDIIHRDDDDRDNRIKRLMWNESQDILWVLTTKLRLYGISINPEAGVLGWHRHLTPNIKVHDVCATTNQDNTYVDTQLIIEPITTIPTGSGFLAHIIDNFEHEELFNTSLRQEDKPVFLDGGQYLNIGVSGTVVDIISVINSNFNSSLTQTDLDDADVNNPANTFLIKTTNGFTEAKLGILNGLVTLPVGSDELIFGIAYESKLRSLVPEVGPNNLLNSQGDIQRFDRATFLLYKTRTGLYGIDDVQYKFEISPNTTNTLKFKADVPSDSGTDSRILVQTSDSLPMSILGIILRGVNNS